MTERTHLTEEEARRLWRRAAELQAEAAARLEERSVTLAGPSDGYVPGSGTFPPLPPSAAGEDPPAG